MSGLNTSNNRPHVLDTTLSGISYYNTAGKPVADEIRTDSSCQSFTRNGMRKEHCTEWVVTRGRQHCGRD